MKWPLKRKKDELNACHLVRGHNLFEIEEISVCDSLCVYGGIYLGAFEELKELGAYSSRGINWECRRNFFGPSKLQMFSMGRTTSSFLTFFLFQSLNHFQQKHLPVLVFSLPSNLRKINVFPTFLGLKVCFFHFCSVSFIFPLKVICPWWQC